MWSIFIFTTLLAACSSTAIPPSIVKDYQRFIEISGDGETHVIDLEEQVDQDALNEISKYSANNQYWLFTRQNPDVPQYLITGEENSVRNSNFDISKPVKVIAHGWTDTGHSEPNPTLRAAFLNRADVNVITIDWSLLADRNYVTAVAGTPEIGRGLGQFLAWLNSLGVPYNNMHLVGYSLGAHLVASAGREVGGRVARVTALDPAGPLWHYNSDRISVFDAIYVEGIHTDGSVQGMGTAIGNADFFPNGGNSMPGCLTSLCNHQMSWRYFAASVIFDHMRANRCDNLIQLSLNRCTGATLAMGNDDLRKYGTGIFRINTNLQYPY